VASEGDHKIFSENQSIRGSFGFESSFKNCFWNLFSNSGLSQICKIRNVWKLPIPFSRFTLISSSEKSSWSLKILFWKKNGNGSTNSRLVMKIFQVQWFPWFWDFMIGYLKP
jgi:hypothetical protein